MVEMIILDVLSIQREESKAKALHKQLMRDIRAVKLVRGCANQLMYLGPFNKTHCPLTMYSRHIRCIWCSRGMIKSIFYSRNSC